MFTFNHKLPAIKLSYLHSIFGNGPFERVQVKTHDFIYDMRKEQLVPYRLYEPIAYILDKENIFRPVRMRNLSKV